MASFSGKVAKKDLECLNMITLFTCTKMHIANGINVAKGPHQATIVHLQYGDRENGDYLQAVLYNFHISRLVTYWESALKLDVKKSSSPLKWLAWDETSVSFVLSYGKRLWCIELF